MEERKENERLQVLIETNERTYFLEKNKITAIITK